MSCDNFCGFNSFPDRRSSRPTENVPRHPAMASLKARQKREEKSFTVVSEPTMMNAEIAGTAARGLARSPVKPRGLRIAPLAIGASILLVAAAALYWARSGPKIPGYLTQKITRGPIVRAVTTSGTVNPVTTVQVGTYVSGTIVAELRLQHPGPKGQLCAKIDPRPYQVVVDQTRANVGVARAQLSRTRRISSTRRRPTTGIAPGAEQGDLERRARSRQERLDQAMAQVALDEATVALKEANLRAAQINLDYTDIVSPVDGTVVTRNVTMGQTVAASFQTPTLFLIATDLTKMQVDTNVSESDIGAIKEGNKARFTVEHSRIALSRATSARSASRRRRPERRHLSTSSSASPIRSCR